MSIPSNTDTLRNGDKFYIHSSQNEDVRLATTTTLVEFFNATLDPELLGLVVPLNVADPTVTGVSADLHSEGYTNEASPRYFKKSGPLDTDWTLISVTDPAVIAVVQDNLDAHEADISNPHSVTSAQTLTALGVSDPTITGVSSPLHTVGYTNESNPRYFLKTGGSDTGWEQIKTSKTDPFVHPSDYGAIGDGVTDDTAAVQAAVAVASSLEKPIIFKPGNYILFSNVLNESVNSITLIGGPGVTIEPRGTLSLSAPNSTLSLVSSITRGDQTITVLDASGVSIGDVIFLKSSVVVETLRNRPHRFPAKVTNVLGNVITVSDPIAFNFTLGDTGLGITHSRGRKVKIESIKFQQSGSSRAVDLRYCSGLIKGCALDGDPAQTNFFMEACADISFRDIEIDNILYGVLVQSCVNARFFNILANNVAGHPISTTYWSRKIYIDWLTGDNNSAIMDSHEAFDVHYSNVYTDSDYNYSNIRSAGGSIRNSKISSTKSVSGTVYFQNISFATTPYDYSGLNKEYDFLIDGLSWKSLDNFEVEAGRNVDIKNSDFRDSSGNVAGIVASGGVSGSITNLSVLNSRFDEANSQIRCNRNDFRELKVPGIVKAIDTGSYDGALVGSGDVTTPGTGYADASAVALTGGAGSGATVNIVTSAGAVTSATFADFGTGYTNGDVLTISGGGADAQITVGYANLCRQTLAIKSGVMGEMGGALRRYSSVLNESFASGGDVVFCLQIGWPSNNLDNGGGNGYSFFELSFLHYIRHANSGVAELKRTNFQGLLGSSSQGIWSTPSHVSVDTGQSNATMALEFMGGINVNPATPASDKYYNAFFKISSGRTNPFYGAVVDVTAIKTAL